MSRDVSPSEDLSRTREATTQAALANRIARQLSRSKHSGRSCEANSDATLARGTLGSKREGETQAAKAKRIATSRKATLNSQTGLAKRTIRWLTRSQQQRRSHEANDKAPLATPTGRQVLRSDHSGSSREANNQAGLTK
ncbi:hypothetical protein BT69DRAFT_1336663 [Atractiella rhizophila]|nr:hypothetical protein BT69DRAFT_1336663 [Atractiella rhizophila]